VCMRTDSVLVVADSLPPSGGGWREYLLRGRAVSGNVKQVAVAILDRLVDDAEEYLEVLLDGVAELEKEILDRYMDPGEVLYLKRLVRQFHREMRSAQPIGGQLLDLAGHLPQVGAFSPEERLRLRNVTDHMTRLLEATQLLEAQMGALMDVYWGALGARTNKQMHRLTTLATLVLPVTFWSGLFGMNFETMPFKEAWFFLAGMAALGATWILVLAYMFRRGVFTRERPAQRRPLFPR
jgi:magnesium transporter